MRRAVPSGIWLVGLGLLAAHAQAQSFDCRRAARPVEHAICKDKALADLDVALARELKTAIASGLDRREVILADERRWLGRRDNQCRAGASGGRMSACLAVLYRARIEYLRTSAHESASGRAQASCQKLAQRYRALANVHPGRSPLEVLVEDSGSGVTLVKPLAVMQNPETDLAAWARKQVPPFDVPPALTKDLISTSEWELSRLPYTDFYSISSNQGTAHCYDTHYFEVRGGRATEAGAPPGFDEQGGASCMVSRSFGRIDGASVYFQEAYDFTPSMSSTLTLATWDGGSFAGACTVTFSFAPAFSDRTLNAWDEECKGEGCQELRRAAFQLAAAVQRDPRRARDQLRSALTPAQQNAYAAALKDVGAENPEEAAADSDDLDPAYITKESPLRLPYVHQGKLYLASVGHFTIGWRHFADWSVEFQSIENGKLVPRASFAVGMAKGRLEGVSVASP